MKHLFAILILFFGSISTINAQQQTGTDKNFRKQRHSAPKQSTVVSVVTARPSNGGRPHCGFARMLDKAKANGYNEAPYEDAFKRMVQHSVIAITLIILNHKG